MESVPKSSEDQNASREVYKNVVETIDNESGIKGILQRITQVLSGTRGEDAEIKMIVDAEMENELHDRINNATSDLEKQRAEKELEMQQKSFLSYNTSNDGRYNLKGYIDGKEVDLHAQDMGMTVEQDALATEWSFSGKIDGEEVSPDDVESIFASYARFADMQEKDRNERIQGN